MKTVNIVCTSKPGDGLFHYSYEYCCYLNTIGIKSQLVILTHHNFSQKEYIDAIKECYTNYENVVFDFYTPSADDITLIMGRSMLTLAYLNKNSYTKDQLLTLHLLFSSNLISVYSENHPVDYFKAIDFFKPKKIHDLCDYDVYPNGTGEQFEKIINFSIYKPIKTDIQFKYLFLGTNEIYYKEVEKHITDYSSHGIIVYRNQFLNQELKHIYVPVKNLLGIFDTYVYTKPNFDPAPRLVQECKWLGKEVIYLRDKYKKDGGSVYWNRPAICLTQSKNKIENLLKLL